MKTVFESICAVWGQTTSKEKEAILREDTPEGSGAAEGSTVAERSGSPSQSLQMKAPELGRLSSSLDLLAAQVEAIEEVDDTDLVPLVYRKRACESHPSEVVESTGGVKDQGVQNSTVEPVGGVSGVVSDERVEEVAPSADQAKRI
ncbi:hypothetical protein Droror1_Dr00023492, partial [Drosera rotundifolia]